MFPSVVFLGMDLYLWMIVIGIIAAMVAFRLLTDKVKLPTKLFNFSMIVGVIGIIVGYLSSVLFQDVYHYLATKEWSWTAGSTFYGGLIGAAIGFLLCYFIAGNYVFKDDNAHKLYFNDMLSCIMPCIVLAHAFGRIGCLCAGCCYGKLTDSWLGIEMWVNGEWQRRLPTQLFESIFLFILFAVLAYLLIKRNNRSTASVYLVSYGVWRFLIEFIRDDIARGSSGIPGLWPSQVTAIVMVIVGIAYYFVYNKVLKNVLEQPNEQKQEN